MQTGRDITEIDGGFSCDLPGGNHALFTTRAHGNLSTQRGEGHEDGRAARDRLCEDLGLQWLCASRQVHGTSVQRVYSIDGAGGQALAIDADGHATGLPGIGTMVLTADCLPVALGSAAAVAMLHAGWRGLAAGVLEEGVRALREVGGQARIAAVIGPGSGRLLLRGRPRGARVRSAGRIEPVRTSTCGRSPASGCWRRVSPRCVTCRRARSATSASSRTVAKGRGPGVRRGWHG